MGPDPLVPATAISVGTFYFVVGSGVVTLAVTVLWQSARPLDRPLPDEIELRATALGAAVGLVLYESAAHGILALFGVWP